jgi:hypothetical protein
MATLRVAVKRGRAPMKVAQISKPGADSEIVEREIPEPDPGHVRIKVQACGVCHSGESRLSNIVPKLAHCACVRPQRYGCLAPRRTRSCESRRCLMGVGRC